MLIPPAFWFGLIMRFKVSGMLDDTGKVTILVAIGGNVTGLKNYLRRLSLY